MISSLKGRLIEKTPTSLVVELNGIGFAVKVSLSTSRTVGNTGEEVFLYTQVKIREESLEIFGFSTREEKELFNILTSVPGIGPKATLNLLSRFHPDEIMAAISENRAELLTLAPTVGMKKAQRIIFELKEKISRDVPCDKVMSDAVSALTSLGLTKSEALTRLEKIENLRELELSEILKIALKNR